jgi:hypothetical protein
MYYSLQGCEMKNNRLHNDDRRQNDVMLSFPFKDSHGATITECRRRIPDRRLNNIHAEWINEDVIR